MADTQPATCGLCGAPYHPGMSCNEAADLQDETSTQEAANTAAASDTQGTDAPPHPPTPDNDPDWPTIKLAYEANILSLREIARASTEAGRPITHVGIKKRADREGWTRNLKAEIKKKADELVAKVATRGVVNTRVSKNGNVVTAGVFTEAEVVLANAKVQASVRIKHQSMAKRVLGTCERLLAELDAETDPETLANLRALGEAMRAPDDKGRDPLNDLYLKVISLPGRTKVLKDLADSLAKLVELERSAHGIGPIKDGEAGDDLPPPATGSASEHYRWLSQQRPKGGGSANEPPSPDTVQ